MQFPIQMTPEQMTDTLQNGSPMLIGAAGRLFGLGADEQQALAVNGIPRVALGVVCVIGGVFVGMYVAKKWPGVARKVVGR